MKNQSFILLRTTKKIYNKNPNNISQNNYLINKNGYILVETWDSLICFYICLVYGFLYTIKKTSSKLVYNGIIWCHF